MFTKYNTTSQVDTIISKDQILYVGSYEYNQNIRTGLIEMYNEEYTLIKSIKTSGTFNLQFTDNSLILACTTKSVMLIDLSLKLMEEVHTNYINTSSCIHNDIIYICTGIGTIDIYTKDLKLYNKIKVSSDILWTVQANFIYIACGGEDGNLYIIKAEDNSVHKTISIGSGITCLVQDGANLLVGSYNENVYRFRLKTLLVQNIYTCTKSLVGGGIWKIIPIGDFYIIVCMYEGIKLTNKKFDVLYSFNEGGLVYGLCVTKTDVWMSLFYNKKMYKISLVELVEMSSIKILE